MPLDPYLNGHFPTMWKIGKKEDSEPRNPVWRLILLSDPGEKARTEAVSGAKRKRWVYETF